MAAINNITATALSGLTAATTRIGAASQNIAVQSVQGARRQLVSQQAQTQNGVTTAIQTSVEPGPSLPEDLVEMKSATYAFKANMKMIQTQDEMMGTLLDRRV